MKASLLRHVASAAMVVIESATEIIFPKRGTGELITRPSLTGRCATSVMTVRGRLEAPETGEFEMDIRQAYLMCLAGRTAWDGP
jgi:hypothetical protein